MTLLNCTFRLQGSSGGIGVREIRAVCGQRAAAVRSNGRVATQEMQLQLQRALQDDTHRFATSVTKWAAVVRKCSLAFSEMLLNNDICCFNV